MVLRGPVDEKVGYCVIVAIEMAGKRVAGAADRFKSRPRVPRGSSGCVYVIVQEDVVGETVLHVLQIGERLDVERTRGDAGLEFFEFQAAMDATAGRSWSERGWEPRQRPDDVLR